MDEKMISGWKTLLGGIVAMLTGAMAIIDAISLDPISVDSEKLKTGLGLLSGGLIAIGLGHKLDKAKTK